MQDLTWVWVRAACSLHVYISVRPTFLHEPPIASARKAMWIWPKAFVRHSTTCVCDASRRKNPSTLRQVVNNSFTYEHLRNVPLPLGMPCTEDIFTLSPYDNEWGLSIDNASTRRLLRGRMIRGLCWGLSLCMCVSVFAFDIV